MLHPLWLYVKTYSKLPVVGISGPTSDQLIPGPTESLTLDQLFVFLSAGYVYVTWTNENQSTFPQLHVSSSVDYDSS